MRQTVRPARETLHALGLKGHELRAAYACERYENSRASPPTGAHATRQRHLRQARYMQAAIQQRFERNPWTWQLKHVRWFLEHHLQGQARATQYYYQLTLRLILRRLGRERDWWSQLRG